jgi:hypothetical protein
MISTVQVAIGQSVCHLRTKFGDVGRRWQLQGRPLAILASFTSTLFGETIVRLQPCLFADAHGRAARLATRNCSMYFFPKQIIANRRLMRIQPLASRTTSFQIRKATTVIRILTKRMPTRQNDGRRFRHRASLHLDGHADNIK